MVWGLNNMIENGGAVRKRPISRMKMMIVLRRGTIIAHSDPPDKCMSA
jgi:hypothetical protein